MAHRAVLSEVDGVEAGDDGGGGARRPHSLRQLCHHLEELMHACVRDKAHQRRRRPAQRAPVLPVHLSAAPRPRKNTALIRFPSGASLRRQ